ncbi:transposase [Lactobacillus ultunensis]|nr:transposase [Lactobacillus ultunensis]
MTDRVYQSVSRRIHKDVIQNYCAQVWLAAKNSYPAVPADSLEIEVISEYCNEVENYNKEITYIQNRLIKIAVSLNNFKIISSIPGAGQLNSALLLGFTGDLARFDNYKQLNAFLGLDLNRYISVW